MVNPRLWKGLLVSGLFFSLLVTGGCGSENGIEGESSNQMAGNREEDTAQAFHTATPPSDPDLRGTEFTVVLFLSGSERYSHIVDSIRRSVSDGFVYFNSRGGVNGAGVSLREINLPDDPEDISDQVGRSLEIHDPVLALMAAPIDEMLYSKIKQQEVPFLNFGLGGTHFDSNDHQSGNIFWLVPYPEVQISTYFNLLWTAWEDLRPTGTYNELFIGYLEETGGSHHQNIKTALDGLDEQGFEIRQRAGVPFSPNASMANFLVDSVQTQVTAIYLNSSSVGTSVLLNDLTSLALEQSFVVGGGIWSVDNGISELLLSERSLDRYIMPLPVSWWTERGNPAVELALEVFEGRNNEGTEKDLAYLVGLGASDIVFEVLSRTVSDGGYGKISGDDVFAELGNLEDYEVLGGLFSVDFTDGKRAPTEINLWQYSDGELKLIGE